VHGEQDGTQSFGPTQAPAEPRVNSGRTPAGPTGCIDAAARIVIAISSHFPFAAAFAKWIGYALPPYAPEHRYWASRAREARGHDGEE